MNNWSHTSITFKLLVVLLYSVVVFNVTATANTIGERKTLTGLNYTNEIAVKYVWPTVPIVFLVIGTIGNILSITVFTRREMIRYSSFWYFAFLNGINLALLYVTSIKVILEFNFDTDIRELSLFTCKLHVFLTYFLGHLSSLLLSMISIDRVVSVIFLQKARIICTPKVAAIVTCTMFIVNFLISSHFLYCESGYVDSQISENNIETSMVKCRTRNGTSYQAFIINAWKIIDMSFLAFVPFFIMTTCSIIIIMRVSKQSKKLQMGKPKSKPPLTTAKVEEANTHEKQKLLFELKVPIQTCANSRYSEALTGNDVCSAFDDPSMIASTTGDFRVKTKITRLSSRTRNLAMMMLPVNILFLVFLAPVVITIYFYEKLGEDKLTLAIVELLSHCNHTFNFFIYFATSSKFRDEFHKFVNSLTLRMVNFKTSPNMTSANQVTKQS
jgi:hypothetical protein